MGYILKGIGDSMTGANEIVPTFDAKIFHFYSQITPGVIASEQNKFPITIVDRGVRIGPGLAHAYGYFGLSDAIVQFNFVIPSSQTQYSKVYAEIDLSSRPQKFSINVTPQSNTSVIELQQDDLSQITTGVYQIPLYLITIQTNATVSFTDIRPMIERLAYANHSIESNHTLQADNATNSTNATTATKSQTIIYTTSAPTSSPASGTLKVYVGSSEPSAKYDRVVYFITV